MVHTSRMTNVLIAITLLWAASQSKPLAAAQLTLPDVPLVVSTTVSPNIILLLDDSGSMTNIVPDTPYNANTTYFTCTGSIALNNGVAYTDTEPTVDLLVSLTGTPSFQYNGTTYNWGTSTGQKCFVPTRTYNARL